MTSRFLHQSLPVLIAVLERPASIMMDSLIALPPGLRQCIKRLGLPDQAIDWSLFSQSLVHASASTQNNNERLEFLGDAVLRLAAAEFLMERYPHATVGELSTLRSHLVSDQILTQIAEQLGLDAFLQMSTAAAGDRAARPTRLADAVEAILAVLYLSKGTLELVRPWIDPQFERFAEHLNQNPEVHNPKTALQELIQKYYKTLPEYRTEEINLAHGDPEKFQAAVWFRDRCLGTGKGPSRKAAEQAAALAGYPVMQALAAESGWPVGDE